MKYFQILDCKEDPFPSEPSLDSYFPAAPHEKCLAELFAIIDGAISPMVVVLGDAGSGKSTMSLQFKEKFQSKNEIHTIFTNCSWFVSRETLISHLAEFLGIGTKDAANPKELEVMVKCAIMGSEHPKSKRYLLIIDQAEKIPYFCLELLEEIFVEKVSAPFLQIVAFARPIFENKIGQYLNLVQKINFIRIFPRFTFAEITGVLDSYRDHLETSFNLDSLTTPAGKYYSYFLSKGNPGIALGLSKLTTLSQIVRNCPKAGVVLCHQTAKEISLDRAKKIEITTGLTIAIALIAMAFSFSVMGHNPVSIPTSKVTNPANLLVAPSLPARNAKKSPAKVDFVVPVVADIGAIKEPDNSKKVVSREGEGNPNLELAPIPSSEKNILVEQQVSPPQNPISSLAVKNRISLVVEDQHLEPMSQKNKVEDGSLVQHVLPEILGEISVFERETLGDMIRRIYGPHSFTPMSLDRVLSYNPYIRSQNFLNVGDIIKFPNVAVKLTAAAETSWWITLITIDTLQDSYRYLRIYDTKEQPLLVIPSWDDNGLFKYTIILQKNFSSKKEAAIELAKLSEQIFPAAKFIDGLNHSTFFYQEVEDEVESRIETKKIDSQSDEAIVPVLHDVSKVKSELKVVSPIGKIPEYLGKLTMTKGDTLGGMIRGVYGRNSVYPQNIKWILRSNISLANPDKIAPGTVLTFPRKAVRIQGNAESNWWIQLGSFSNLQDAYSFLRDHTSGKPWLLIIPTLGSESSVYRIMVEKSFTQDSLAYDKVAKLAQAGFSGITVIEGLDHQKFFYKAKLAKNAGKKK